MGDPIEQGVLSTALKGEKLFTRLDREKMLQVTGGPGWSGRSVLRFICAFWVGALRNGCGEEVGPRKEGWERLWCCALDLALGDQSCVIIFRPLGPLLTGVLLTVHSLPWSFSKSENKIERGRKDPLVHFWLSWVWNQGSEPPRL